MSLTLGLDLGPTSIGWALVDESRQEILGAGVRVFPEGVDRDQQGGEKSKHQSRRVARGMRRQIRRRAKRLRLLRDALVSVGMLPPDPDELNRVLAKDPYELRRRALDDRLTPYELGRVILHLGQRRGFLSNRKTDRSREKETKGMLAEMTALETEIGNSESRTLGEYLAGLNASFDHATATEDDRMRRRHTRRHMHLKEFDAIWAAQRAYYPGLLSDNLRYGRAGPEEYPKKPSLCPKDSTWLSEFGLQGILFFQRKMYWPRSVVGRCELEPREKRCPRADRAAQKFRILQEVNNLRLLDLATRKERKLGDQERARLVDYLMGTKEATFDQIRKKLELADTVRFNLERAERKKLKGHETDAALRGRKILGKQYDSLPEEVRDRIVDILVREDMPERAVARLISDCGLTNDQAVRAAGVNLPDGHMSFSRLAIGKLLPHLERGLLLMADDATNSALHAGGYLRPDERAIRQRRFLPPPPDLTNPIVRQGTFEVRKVVNAILRELVYPRGQGLTTIHVELAREAKKSFDERREIRFEQAARRKSREEAEVWLEGFGEKATRAKVNRHLLWQEQQEYCPYCAQKISTAQLLGGEADVDHILPRWRSLDNCMANKVVAHRKCNDEKGDRTPREWLEAQSPERYEQTLALIQRVGLPYGKQRKFQQRDIQLDEFVERQLRDTAYISRCVSGYLQCLGARVVCPRGQMTAELRHYWGLNNILDDTGRGRKIRHDHRHHAVDAVALAMTNRQRLHALANARGENVRPPWETFWREAAEVIRAISVSHRARRGIVGKLHEDTYYGPTQKLPGGVSDTESRSWAKEWVEREGTFVCRRPLSKLTTSRQLQKVRDPAIRRILQEHLRAQGVDPHAPEKLPKNAFVGERTPRMPSGVPIKRVRMLEESNTFRPVARNRPFQCVQPGSNHHVVYRAVRSGAKEQWECEVTTMYDAAQRAKAGEHLVDRADGAKGRFLFSLSIGEMFEIDSDSGDRLRCVVHKIKQDGRLYYKHHTDARKDSEREELYLSTRQMQRRNARKVTVDAIGRVRRARD